MVLKNVPDFPARLTVTETMPWVCGASTQGVLGSLATVQPHEVCTRSICTGVSNTLVTLKAKSAVLWPASGVCSLRMESHWSESSSGLGGVTGAAAGTAGADVGGVGGGGVAVWAEAQVIPSRQAPAN